MTNPEKMCVKELASSMLVSERYIYEMRRLGFKMSGVKHTNQTATVNDAVAWIRANDFRMVRGIGSIKPGGKQSQGLQT